MAYLKQALTEDEIKKLTVAGVKKAYNTLAELYNKIINLDIIYCQECNDFITRNNFYKSNKTASGVIHVGCKKCLLKMATDYDKKTGIYKDNKEKAKKTLMLMDLPFIEKTYDTAIADINNAVNERNRGTAWTQYMVMIQSLPQYRNLTYADSEFEINGEFNDEEEIKENSRILKSAKKRFGQGYSNSELIFLENEYLDWTRRYQCENKAQEILFKRVCFKELDIDKAQKTGKDTKELDRSLQELLGSLNLKPSQNNSNVLTESKTFGQLIEKWENEKPIPEPDEEFKDVDKIGLYIDVFFKGHLAKMMGLKNGFSALYEKFIKKYTVNKPQYDEDSDSEILFEQIFGSKVDDE